MLLQFGGGTKMRNTTNIIIILLLLMLYGCATTEEISWQMQRCTAVSKRLINQTKYDMIKELGNNPLRIEDDGNNGEIYYYDTGLISHGYINNEYLINIYYISRNQHIYYCKCSWYSDLQYVRLLNR